jgi:predicted PurR-regulated permease PerM
VLLPLALLGLWDLARASGSVLLIVVAASLIALILNPISKYFEHVMPRALAILCSYLLVLVLAAGVVFVLADPVANQVNHFSDHVPMYVKKANDTLDSIQRWFNQRGIKIHIKSQGQTALSSIEHRITTSSGSIVSFSRDVLGKAISFGADLVLTFVLSVYLLAYAKPIGQLVRRVVPPGDGTPEDDFPTLIQRAVSGYVRGQLLFSLVMGASATLGLYLFGLIGLFPDGRTLAFFFGAFYGLMELIPYVGPVIGPIPAVLVALFTNPVSAIWVVGLFVGLQQLEGHLVAPQLFRLSLRINPILVILALLIGFKLYGIVGALLALPVAAVIRQTVVYMRRHLALESWGPARPPTDALVSDEPPDVTDEPSNTPGADEPQQRSALSGDLEEPVGEEGGDDQEDDRDCEAEAGDDREHERHHAREAGH